MTTGICIWTESKCCQLKTYLIILPSDQAKLKKERKKTPKRRGLTLVGRGEANSNRIKEDRQEEEGADFHDDGDDMKY